MYVRDEKDSLRSKYSYGLEAKVLLIEQVIGKLDFENKKLQAKISQLENLLTAKDLFIESLQPKKEDVVVEEIDFSKAAY